MDIKKSITIILLIIISFSLYSQVVKFEKVYGGSSYDYGYAVTQTYDKGYVVVGASSSFGSGNMDAVLLKVDSLGVETFHRTYGGINIDHAYSVKETSDSGLVIAGYTNSVGFGGYDMFLVRTNKMGDTIWTKTFGGSNWDFAYSAQQTTDGGFIIAGSTYSYGEGNSDMYLVKTNSNGDTTWTKTFGGSNDDEAKSVKQTSDGGYIIAGTTKSYGDLNGDMYIVKTNVSGDTLWTYRFAGSLEDAAYDITETPSRYLVVGKTKSAASNFGNFQGYTIELSFSGNVLNNFDYGGSAEDGLNAVTYSSGGRFAVLGYTYSYGGGAGTNDYYLFIHNPFNGYHPCTFGGIKMDHAYALQNTADGGYIICGTSNSYSSFDHIYLVKTDSNGVSSGIVTTHVVGIGSNTEIKTDFIIYPNPTSNKLYLQLPDAPYLIVRLHDMLGKELFSEKLRTGRSEMEINVDEFANGLYFISIEYDGRISSKRLVIQH
ncbi:MAG: hypothetical protein K0S44_2708 [Bacteroidetes bacterium]|jgi:hypothetical protein|nr:hypothetical protein [Bacteroidota bacterium]